MKRVFVAGHAGMVGSAICRRLAGSGVEVITRTRAELNLVDQKSTEDFFDNVEVDAVVLAAAKVGGIHANNSFPADFIYDNLMIQSNVVQGAYRAGINRLLFLGSSCIYPRDVPQPMREEALLTGVLEKTNEPYAIAKIAGIKLCESFNRQYGTDYRSLMPTNLYGPGDNFHPEHSHVLPALIRRFQEAVDVSAPEVLVWGSGNPRREFLHVDDLADAAIFVLNIPRDDFWSRIDPTNSHLNVGSGSDVSIAELAKKIAAATGYTGSIRFDATKPDGTMRKLMDGTRLAEFGWKPTIPLDSGIAETVSYYRRNIGEVRSF